MGYISRALTEENEGREPSGWSSDHGSQLIECGGKESLVV